MDIYTFWAMTSWQWYHPLTHLHTHLSSCSLQMSLSFTLSAILWHFAGALIGRRDGWLKWLKPTCSFPPHWLMLSVPICNSVEAQIQTTNSTWPKRSLFCLYNGGGVVVEVGKYSKALCILNECGSWRAWPVCFCISTFTHPSSRPLNGC